jgi:hypothetical protein
VNYNMPNNREWALLIWLGALLVWALWKASIGSNLVSLIRAALHPKILVPLIVMLGFIALEAWFGSILRLWRPELIKDTAIWLAVAVGLLLKSAAEVRRPHFFRSRLSATLGITEFLAFFTSLIVFGLIAEGFLQGFLFLLATLSAFASAQAQTRIVKTIADGMLVITVLLLFVFSIQYLVANWSDIDKGILLQQLALPIWLTAGLLPFVYLFGLYATYESVFVALDYHGNSRRARRRAKLALVSKFHVRAHDAGTFSGLWLPRIASAPSFTAARQVVGEFEESQREAERAATEEQERFRRYAGSQETDAEGRRLDRREFKETTRALRWLADAQMGWYHNEDRGGRRQYRADLLRALVRQP